VLASVVAQSSSGEAPIARSLWGVWRVVSARGRGFGGPNLSLPLSANGRAAAARYDARDDPLTECIPLTTPASITSEYLLAIEQNGANVLLRDELYEVIRTVYLDGRAHPPADQRFQRGIRRVAGTATRSSSRRRILLTTLGASASAFRPGRRSASSSATASPTAERR
jgi:hypothetical protein